MSIQEIIDNQFDELENWIDEEFENIKKDCINMYNNFKVNYKINRNEDIKNTFENLDNN